MNNNVKEWATLVWNNNTRFRLLTSVWLEWVGIPSPLTEAVHLWQSPVLVTLDVPPLVVIVMSLLPTNQDWLLPPSSKNVVTGVLKQTSKTMYADLFWWKDTHTPNYSLKRWVFGLGTQALSYFGHKAWLYCHGAGGTSFKVFATPQLFSTNRLGTEAQFEKVNLDITSIHVSCNSWCIAVILSDSESSLCKCSGWPPTPPTTDVRLCVCRPCAEIKRMAHCSIWTRHITRC